MQQLNDRHDHVDHRPGGGDEDDREHDHFFRSFARGFDQIFATQVVTTKVAVIAGPVALPSAGARLEEEIGSRKSIIIELKVWFHDVRYSLDRSTSQ